MEMSSYSTKISSKGQVVIPVELRDQLGLKKGTRATWREDQGQLILSPVTRRSIAEMRGLLKPAPGAPTAFDELFAERAREKKREDEK